jgi:flagellar biosynthetic protein FliR
MQTLLQDLVLDQLLVYILTFARMGTVLMIMPGIGDSFVSPRIRLLIALSFSVVLAPVSATYLPEVTTNIQLVWLVLSEMVVGFFIGTIARIFLAALDTAGMLIGMQIGLGNAMVFNPQMAGQGSVIGAFLSITGAVLLFATDLHHMLIYGMVDSYNTFPAGDIPLTEGMAQTITKAVSQSFAIGFYMSVPFMIVSLFLYIAMGVLGRLMPQIQVFILALPIQIILGVVVLSVAFSSLMLFWLTHYDDAIQIFFTNI